MSTPPSTSSSFQAALEKELQHLQLHLSRLHEEGLSAVRAERGALLDLVHSEDPVPSSFDRPVHRRRAVVSLGEPLPTLPEEVFNDSDGSKEKKSELDSTDKYSTLQSISVLSPASPRLALPRAADFGSSLGLPRAADFGSGLGDMIVHPLRGRRSKPVVKMKKSVSFEVIQSSLLSKTNSTPSRLGNPEPPKEVRRTITKASNAESRMHRSVKQLIKDAENVGMDGMLDYLPQVRHGKFRMLVDDLHGWYRSNETRDVVITILDIVVCFIIVLNCILLGISLDKETWSGWRVFDYCFIAIFLFEIVLKLMLLGCREMYFGRAWAWAWYDTAICIMSIVEIFAEKQTAIVVFRLFRLGRLGRLFRVVVVKELVMIFRGMAGGARCLFWCLLALLLPVYMIGMVLSSPRVLKDWGEQGLFSTVPAAMFTTIRCMCGDCNDMLGRPIIVQLQNEYGGHFAFFYSIFILVSLFGVFNLITAIFLENTMQVAKSDAMLQRQLRENKDKKFARDMKRLVFMFWEAHSHFETDVAQTSTELARSTNSRSYDKFNITDALDLEITQEFYDKLVGVPGVREVLEDIGILHDDIVDLFQILDVDHSGTLDLTELVDGINKLRGEATKRDLVALAYMIYAMQDSVREIGVELAGLAGGRLPACPEEDGAKRSLSSKSDTPVSKVHRKRESSISASTSSYSLITTPALGTIAA